MEDLLENSYICYIIVFSDPLRGIYCYRSKCKALRIPHRGSG